MNPCNTRLYCQGGSLFFGLFLRQKVCYPGIYTENNLHIYYIFYPPKVDHPLGGPHWGPNLSLFLFYSSWFPPPPTARCFIPRRWTILYCDGRVKKHDGLRDGLCDGLRDGLCDGLRDGL